MPSLALALAISGAFGTVAAQDDVIVVRGALVPDEKRATSEISSLLEAEDFQRQGDSDIAAALRRVTGISVIDGKFPVARGLNERYSSATLNGIPLPSPEPLRRAAPLDLVPTSVLAGSLAQKTFSPEFSGEFGGAAIDLQTVGVPDETYFSASIGFEIDTVSTMQDGFFYDGSDTDVFGFDDGLRNLPGLADAAFRNGVSSVGQDTLDLAFDQDKTLLITGEDVPASGSFSLTGGLVVVDNGDLRIGTTTYLGYSNEWENRDGFQNRTEDTDFSDIQTRVEQDFLETRQTIDLNAFNTTGFEFGPDHELNLTSFILRSTLKRARISEGFDEDRTSDLIRREFSDYIEREVWQAQLSGEHLFPDLADLEASWRVAYGEAERSSPYERLTSRSQAVGSDEAFAIRQGLGRRAGNELNFAELTDENFYAGVDFVFPVMLFGGESSIKFGGAYEERDRTNLRRDFSVFIDVEDALADSRIDLIYSDPVVSTDRVNFVPDATNQFPDTSEASLEVLAAYSALDVEFNEFLRASVGVRFEDSTEESSVGLTSDPALTSFEPLEEEYFLPAVTVTWNPVGNIQVRGAYSQTITRPQFRELAPTDFIDPDIDVTLQGNPFLTNSEIENFDVRAEWYFGRGQFVTVGAFYKDIDKPIEQFFTGQEGGATSFLNAPKATLWGFEAEFERTFDLSAAFENGYWIGKELFLSTNYTYSDSEVEVEDGETVILNNRVDNTPLVVDATDFVVDGRSLVGQSDHLFNFQLGVENVDTGASVTGLLNYASERVLFAEGNDASALAVLEQPPVTLDLVINQPLEVSGGTYDLGIKVQNILGDDFDAYREDDAGTKATFFEYDKGTKFSVSLSRDF
ncbi:TonB-dependent receptor [Parvularcula bermudensis HTCC2503]|uniref:TonB-dependent receptor n=1 Tax=Parvularcula bermudensis (strain ATCC BAA-594 / HTCC2503 / KCTC 12087) TaxID=314260 RepID=E0TBP8_PARBH|nr:TonB-dependent receptor [Parvularcula bermudensis HTCC2503]